MALIGVSTGFLVRAYPVTGGAFTYAYLGFGRRHAFVCGWFLIMGYAAIVALNASAMGLMIKFLFPQVVETGYLYSIAGWQVYIVQILIVSAVLLLYAWLNIRGAGVSGQTQFIFCCVLIVAAWALFLGMIFSPPTTFHNVTPFFKPGLPTWSAIAAIVAISPWAYIGFDTVPQAAEEFNFSPSKATLLILGALTIAAIHYAVMVIATALAMPWTQLVNHHYLWGTGQAIEGVLGEAGLAVLALALCMGIFTGLIGFYISASRLMFAMGRAGALPPVFSKLHTKHNTPYGGIVFVCAICLLVPWFGRSVLLWVVDMSAVGVSIAFLYYCSVAYKFFKWTPNSVGSHFSKEVAPIKKCVALLGTLCSIGFLGLLLIPGSPGFLEGPAWIALLLWIVLGFVFYMMYSREYLQMPKKELDHLILGASASQDAPKEENDRVILGKKAS
jgi:amino acid transporter